MNSCGDDHDDENEKAVYGWRQLHLEQSLLDSAATPMQSENYDQDQNGDETEDVAQIEGDLRRATQLSAQIIRLCRLRMGMRLKN